MGLYVRLYAFTKLLFIGESIPAENYNKQPIPESHVGFGQEKDGAAARGNEGQLQRSFLSSKRARRPAVRLKPRPPRHNTTRLSVDEAVQSKEPCGYLRRLELVAKLSPQAGRANTLLK